MRFWQVGNERSGQDYEVRLAAFCEAMKKEDPSIELMSSYPTPNVLERGRRLAQLCVAPSLRIANLRAEEDSLNSVRKMIGEHAKGRRDHGCGHRMEHDRPATGARAAPSSGTWRTPWRVRDIRT